MNAAWVELELQIAKDFGMYPVGRFWFDPYDNTLNSFDGTEMSVVAELDEEERDRFMVPDANCTWTWCTDVRCVLSVEAHHKRHCEMDENS